jgi:tricorn protease
MEREGVNPDVAVDASPEDLAKGTDAQLSKAVEVVTQDVVAWKKARHPAGGGSGSGSVAPTPPMATPPK